MIKQTLITGIAAAVLLLSTQASAEQGRKNAKNMKKKAPVVTKPVKPNRHKRPPMFNVDKEQRQQARMIQRGIRSCQITPREARRLDRRQYQIQQTERRLKRHGLQRWEVKQLKRELGAAREQINRLSNNHRTCGRQHNNWNKRSHRR